MNGISQEELRWLTSPEAENGWLFALTLGKLDEERKYLNNIIENSPDNVNGLLLSGYLNSRAESEGESFREELLDQIATSKPQLAFGCTWRGKATHRGVVRTVGLVKSRSVPLERLRMLTYGGWLKSLSDEDAISIAQSMFDIGGEGMLQASMETVHQIILNRPELVNAMEPLIWKLLAFRPSRNWHLEDWEWGQLAQQVAQHDPEKTIEIVLSFFELDWFVPLEDDGRMIALKLATEKEPELAWTLIGDAIIAGGKIASGLIVALSRWYGELIPINILIDWATRNRPQGPWVVARFLPVRPTISDKVRALLTSFPHDQNVKSQLSANLYTGGFVGPISGRTQSNIDLVRVWTEDPTPVVRAWASELLDGLEKELAHQKIIEEEEEDG